MHSSYKIHSHAKPPRYDALALLSYVLTALCGAWLLLLLTASAAQAQTTIVDNVVLGPPRVETHGGTTFWWAEATGGDLETTCAARQDFDMYYGPYGLQPFTGGMVYQILDEAGENNRNKAFVAAVVNSANAGDPVRFTVEYYLGSFGNDCVITNMELAP